MTTEIPPKKASHDLHTFSSTLLLVHEKIFAKSAYQLLVTSSKRLMICIPSDPKYMGWALAKNWQTATRLLGAELVTRAPGGKKRMWHLYAFMIQFR